MTRSHPARVARAAIVLATLAASPGQAATPDRTGPRLRYLRHLVATGRIAPPARVGVWAVVDESWSEHALPAGSAPRLSSAGTPQRTRNTVALLATLDALEPLAAAPGVRLLETSWFPRAPLPPLDVSRPQIESPLLWPERDRDGAPLTGQGVLIADFDTGVDVFHPHFFRADAGSFAWLDVDASGDPTPGVDAIDLDGNGFADAGETLRILETQVSTSWPGSNPAGCDADLDWVYADTDGDGQRDFGRGAGFSDASPGFGEPLFAVDDRDGDNRLAPSESLLRLGSSKIRAVRERDGMVRRRGIDLIDAEGDNLYPHGTWVAGILIGGLANHSRFAGQAPDAELIMADMFYPSLPPFEDDMATLALWARSEGARVMLYESGNWVWAWLDGSHPNEITMSDLAAEGFVQLTPTGNLSGGGQQQTRAFSAGIPGTLSATTRAAAGATTVWPSLLWRGQPGELSAELDLPGGATLVPCYCATSETAGGYTVYSDRSLSPRGTSMLNLEVRATDGSPVSGSWTFRITAARDLLVHAYSWDDRSGWSGNTVWDQADNLHTVTQPATGDVSIAVAAYSPRDCSGCAPPGPINGFSGRGTRIDGVEVVDLAAPGSTVYAPAPWQLGLGLGAITGFGGTSSALPHAAGAAALLVQLNPNDPHAVIERLLRASALADGFTGPVPSSTWGSGKLRLQRAFELASKPSILRDDSMTALGDARALRFPGSGPGLPSLDLTGNFGYSHEGEGGPLALPGASDGDSFLAAHVDPGFLDPEGPAVLAARDRPLIFYQATGTVVLRLAKSPAGVGVFY